MLSLEQQPRFVGEDAESKVSAVSGLPRLILTVVSPATDQLPSPHKQTAVCTSAWPRAGQRAAERAEQEAS